MQKLAEFICKRETDELMKNLDKLYKSIRFDKISLWCIIYDTRRSPFIKRFNDHPKIVELECKDDGNVAVAVSLASLLFVFLLLFVIPTTKAPKTLPEEQVV